MRGHYLGEREPGLAAEHESDQCVALNGAKALHDVDVRQPPQHSPFGSHPVQHPRIAQLRPALVGQLQGTRKAAVRVGGPDDGCKRAGAELLAELEEAWAGALAGALIPWVEPAYVRHCRPAEQRWAPNRLLTRVFGPVRWLLARAPAAVLAMC